MARVLKDTQCGTYKDLKKKANNREEEKATVNQPARF